MADPPAVRKIVPATHQCYFLSGHFTTTISRSNMTIIEIYLAFSIYECLKEKWDDLRGSDVTKFLIKDPKAICVSEIIP
jgi:hypothetical protein